MNIEWHLLFKTAMNYGIAPSEFWQLTLPELMAIITENRTEIISNIELKQLKQQFPDR